MVWALDFRFVVQNYLVFRTCRQTTCYFSVASKELKLETLSPKPDHSLAAILDTPVIPRRVWVPFKALHEI